MPIQIPDNLPATEILNRENILSLKWEYDRDVAKGLPIAIPKNYYPKNNPAQEPIVKWRSHANLLYVNWLNYYVYQETPFDLYEIR